MESHIRKMRSLYDQRRQVLVQALNTHFGEQVTIFGENAGIHIMVKFDTHLSDETIIERAETVGVGLMSARSSYLNSWSHKEEKGQGAGGKGEDRDGAWTLPRISVLEGRGLYPCSAPLHPEGKGLFPPLPAPFPPASSGQGEFIFGYAELDEMQIQEGIGRLVEVFK